MKKAEVIAFIVLCLFLCAYTLGISVFLSETLFNESGIPESGVLKISILYAQLYTDKPVSTSLANARKSYGFVCIKRSEWSQDDLSGISDRLSGKYWIDGNLLYCIKVNEYSDYLVGYFIEKPLYLLFLPIAFLFTIICFLGKGYVFSRISSFDFLLIRSFVVLFIIILFYFFILQNARTVWGYMKYYYYGNRVFAVEHNEWKNYIANKPPFPYDFNLYKISPFRYIIIAKNTIEKNSNPLVSFSKINSNVAIICYERWNNIFVFRLFFEAFFIAAISFSIFLVFFKRRKNR